MVEKSRKAGPETHDGEDHDDAVVDSGELSVPPAARSADPADKSRRSWLPDWAPWAVLSSLVTFGLLGGLGIVPLAAFNLKTAQADSERAPASSSKAVASAAPHAALPAPSGSAKDGEEWIRVSHLVITHKDTMLGQYNKAKRTREEARKLAEEALARARKGEDFVKLVLEYSDEPRTLERKGEVPRFKRGLAVKGFEEASFKLKVGELSPVIESGLGMHVILRRE